MAVSQGWSHGVVIGFDKNARTAAKMPVKQELGKPRLFSRVLGPQIGLKCQILN
jgi:hypothetical protein